MRIKIEGEKNECRKKEGGGGKRDETKVKGRAWKRKEHDISRG